MRRHLPSSLTERTPVMSIIRTTAATVALALLVAGCGGAVAGGARDVSEEAHAKEVRSVLTEADVAAREYGRKHLGHYLDLGKKNLIRAGLQLPDGIDLDVRTNHTGYCLVATSEELPDAHPWARATIGPKLEAPSPNDRCARSRY